MLRAMTFNVLMGGGDEARFSKVLSTIENAQPDLLVLQECLGWGDGEENAQRVAQVCERLGIPSDSAHAVLGVARPRGSGRRFHVALFSRRPILSSRVHADPCFLGHALIEARVDEGQEAPLTVFGAHLDSHGESLRFVEARYLRAQINPEAFSAQPFLLMGDLNALSPHDPYPANLGALLLRARVDKYHHPPRFEVMEELLAFGWADLLRDRAAGAWITAPRDRGGVSIDYRTDYILASPALAQRSARCEVIEVSADPRAGGPSDHRPVVAEFGGSSDFRGALAPLSD